MVASGRNRMESVMNGVKCRIKPVMRIRIGLVWSWSGGSFPRDRGVRFCAESDSAGARRSSSVGKTEAFASGCLTVVCRKDGKGGTKHAL